MPGYGTLPEGEGGGLLPWSWAEERLVRSHDFWLATVTPQGAPHLMPVWAVWITYQVHLRTGASLNAGQGTAPHGTASACA